MPFYQYETDDKKVIFMKQGSIKDEQPESIVVKGNELIQKATILDGIEIIPGEEYQLYKNRFPGGSFKLATGFNHY